MKRCWIITLALLLAVTFFGCTKQECVYTVTRNGIDFQVDTGHKTISDADHTYQYDFSGDSSSFDITITYPDGSTYWYAQSGSMGHGGWSDNYDEDAYVPGDTLVDIVQEKAPEQVKPGKITGAIVVIALGILDFVFPKASWYLGYGWRYKNAEPSDAALIFARVAGVIIVIIGIVLLLD